MKLISSLKMAVLGMAVTAMAGADLSKDQSWLFDFWNDAAKKQCAAKQVAWEISRDRFSRLMGAKSAPSAPEEYAAAVQLGVARAELGECKGDYWLHFLITPQLICDEKRPVGCKPEKNK